MKEADLSQAPHETFAAPIRDAAGRAYREVSLISRICHGRRRRKVTFNLKTKRKKSKYSPR